MIEESRLEDAAHFLEKHLIQTTSPRRKRRAQQWFDQECYKFRKEVIETLPQIKTNIQKTTLLQTYNEKIRLYKRLVKEKKRTYWEKEGKISRGREQNPRIAIRLRRQSKVQYINMKEWQTHLSYILNKEGLITTTNRAQENDTQLSTEWTPLSTKKIQNAIAGVNNKKSRRTRHDTR